MLFSLLSGLPYNHQARTPRGGWDFPPPPDSLLTLPLLAGKKRYFVLAVPLQRWPHVGRHADHAGDAPFRPLRRESIRLRPRCTTDAVHNGDVHIPHHRGRGPGRGQCAGRGPGPGRAGRARSLDRPAQRARDNPSVNARRAARGMLPDPSPRLSVLEQAPTV